MKIKNNILLAAVGIAGAIGVSQRFTTDLPTHVTVKHRHYTTYYDVTEHEADSVSWNLTPEMVTCKDKPVRKDRFADDPLIPDTYRVKDNYVGSSYDKGHLFSYEDASCDSIDRVECFYMSNMLPQPHYLNAGKWKTLEGLCRTWAKTQSLHIIAGGIGHLKTIGNGQVVVPRFCYKAVLVNGSYQCWIFPNDTKLATSVSLDSCRVSAALLDQQTGLKL
ncbi:DNA/RNA non-specific endonuclease [Mucilaginibacter sp.]|uniref:DNA/RNA non-specific endonuclease n=1 Tax=Mucilaginibacter sp. TaxID=1882438 RepID=UPI002ECFC1F7